jgi:hypothetical protein
MAGAGATSGPRNPLLPAFITDKLYIGMRDDDETHLHVTYASHWDMDDAFCARMRAAIAAGLESAPVGVVTTPGTKKPKYVPAESTGPPASSSLNDMDL